MPLSYIGKKLEEDRKKKELPSIQETINRTTGGVAGGQSRLPKTSQPQKTLPRVTTPQTTVQTAPLQEALPKVREDTRLSNIERFRLFEGQEISQGTEDPVIQKRKENPLQKIPALGEFVFGTQGEGNDLYQRGSFQQQFAEQGLVGFFLESFTKRQNPTQKEIGELIDSRVSKLQKEGYEPGKAMDVAIQDVINKTPGSAQNISDLKNPNIKLTDKEEEILKWINLSEDVFAVLDAPVFAGTTKPAKAALTETGEKLVEFVDRTKDILIKRLEEAPTINREGFGQPDILAGTDKETQSYIDFLKETDDVSLNELNQGLELLRLQGKQVDDLTQQMQDIVFDIKKDPAPYIQDPVTGKMQGRRKVDVQGAVDEAIEPFTTEGAEVTTKIINELEGKTTVNKQFISDLTNRGDIKQAEKDVIREVLEEYPDGKINAKEFGEKVQVRLLPLDTFKPEGQGLGDSLRYENITLSDEVRGDVANYSEILYTSPIKNSAGDVHFSGEVDDYFAHTRIEDMADGSTRRVIEVQSDLFQKGRLEGELPTKLDVTDPNLDPAKAAKINEEIDAVRNQITPYRNTWWERIVREEVKKAAQDGKSVLQFPTGETAMKIEGLGDTDAWEMRVGTNKGAPVYGRPTPEELEKSGVGTTILRNDEEWIVTEVGENGKFRAVPENRLEEFKRENQFVIRNVTDGDIEHTVKTAKEAEEYIKNSPNKEDLVSTRNSVLEEQFDISGKVDTNNPIYKFYEKDVQKYLTKNFDAKVVTDENGVKWTELKVNPALADKPVEAFAGLPAGYEEDEEGNITIDPTKAFLGMAAAGFLGKRFNRAKTKSSIRAGETGRLSESARLSQSEQTALPKKGQTQYPLGSEKFYSSLSNEYQKIIGESITEGFAKVDNLGTIDKSKLPAYTKFKQALYEAHVKAVENIQDDMYRVRLLIENPNVKITDDTDPYMAEILFHGRVGSRLETARDTVISIDRNLLDSAKKNGVPDRDMSVLVNKYLHARHTPERNAALGDGASGLTTADALEIKAEIEALPYADDVIKIADEIQDLNNQTLDVLLEGQVIDKELYDTLRNKYKTHVPLQRVLDDQQDMAQVIAGKGFDVRSSGIKRAKGSDKDVADILANVVTNFEQAIIRAEKNRVDLTTLQFARDNKHLGLFEEIKPKVIGRLFSGEEAVKPARDILETSEDFKQVVDSLESEMGRAEFEVVTEMIELSKAGRKFTNDAGELVVEPSTFPKWIPSEYRDMDLFTKVVNHFENGTVPATNATRQHELLKIVNEEISQRVDPSLLDEQALNQLAKGKNNRASQAKAITDRAEGSLITEKIFDPTVLELMENGKKVYLKINDESLAMALKGVNRQSVPHGFKTVAAITRFYSGLQTRFNPEFAFPNKIRDLQEMVVYAGSRQELGFKGGVNATLKRGAYTGVLDFVRGADTDMAKLYKQMMDDGGTTGGISLSTREAIELDIAQIRKLNRSNPRAAADKVIRAIDDFNRLFEDSTRLAVYKEALDRGVSRKKAAMMAKEASVNFNKFGKGGSLINALWMFSNAGIQGTTKFIRAMANPKVAAITATSVYAAVHGVGEWNDTLDPEWRDKVPEWDRTNGLPIVLPPRENGDFSYFVLPVAWGIKPMKVTMDYLYDLSQGIGTDPKDAAAGIMAAFVNAYNPLGGTDTLSMATPTILDIPSEITRNQAWHGGMIRPDWDERKAHLQYFSDLKDSTTGEIAVKVTNGLSKVGIEISPASLYYAYQGYIGGAGRTTTDAVNTMISLGRGEMPEEKDIPIWSRFVKTRDNEVLGAEANFYQKLKDKDIEADSERAQLRFDAEEALARMENIAPEEAAKLFDQLAANDPELAEKVVEIKKENDLGLTYTDRALKNLGVQNGDRAEMILDRMNELKSDEERAALWDEYVEKKIITKQVADQIAELRTQ